MLILKTEELMILLNQLPDAVSVRAPLLDSVILQLDFSARLARVHGIVSSSEYHTAYESRRRAAASGDAANEVPDYNRFRQAFWQAGFIEPANWQSEVRPLLKRAAQSNPARGEDIYFLGFDSNALRHRLYSSWLAPQSPRDPRYNLVLCDIVRQELDVRLGKISDPLLGELDRSLPGLGVHQVFANQNRLADRLRLIGWMEFSSALASQNCQFLESQSTTVGDPDEMIISLYETFAQHPGRKVVLFSSDNEFTLRCRNRPNLIGQLVTYPNELQAAYSIRWEQACRLLSIHSLIYGRVDLVLPPDMVITVYGIWREKRAEDWDRDHLAVGIPPQLTEIDRAVRRNLTALKAAVST